MLCFKSGELKKRGFFQLVTQTYSAKQNPSSRNMRQTYDLPITSLAARISFNAGINRLLVTPFSNLKSYGDRAFSVSAPKLIMELVTS